MKHDKTKQDEISSVIDAFGIGGPGGESAVLDFKDLMRFRINNILLVSSLYDFHTLVEDGQLTEAVFNEFLGLNLQYAPSISRVNSGEAALALLEQRQFDLVITMQRLGDMELVAFCAAVKQHYADLPVVLLAYQSRELQLVLETNDISVFDRVFIWSGDTKLFLAIIKLLEDIRNAPVDCLGYGVRTIILIEDSPSFYSSYLPLIYTELIKQGQMLIEEGRNFAEKLMRHRARPKILLATSYEEAWAHFRRYRGTLLGIITDMTFSHRNEELDDAGLRFIRQVRKEEPELPILLQTASIESAIDIEEFNVSLIDKNSRMLFNDLSDFIEQNFGFGDFIFRMPDGAEINRAKNMRELRDKLRYVQEDSIRYHASRDHFSNWLMARTQFSLAKRLKPIKINQFTSIDELRQYLINAFSHQILQDQYGTISEFSRQEYDLDATFVRIGGGSIGGKARGLAFVNSMLKQYLEPNAFPDVKVSIPRTIVLGTNVFTQFIEANQLLPIAVQNAPDEQIVRAFLRADLPPTVLGDLRAVLHKAKFPLAIRSSSLLEDALYQPFAGIYATVMIPNSSNDFSVRFFNLTQAIKFVFASTYLRSAKNYIEATGNRLEEEKMAVIIQEMVGEKYYTYFYPTFSGVARSYNYYPFGKAKHKDGVVNVALGLGKTIVDGGVSLQFSPAYPTVFPQFGTTKDLFYNSQVKFFALDLASDIIRKYPSEDQNLVQLELKDAELHGTLPHIASTWSRENDALYEGIGSEGPRVLNFAPILKTGVFPLTSIVKLLMNMCETAINAPVEIEFAVRLAPNRGVPAEFSFLQVRPMVKQEGSVRFDMENTPADCVVLKSEHALGNGISRLREILFVKPEVFDAMRTRRMAEQITAINRSFTTSRSSYLLIGPGRWGSSDPSLGIPVKFPDISNARAIVETTLPNMLTDPSQGSHFFQNMTSFRIVYFTQRHYNEHDRIDWDWLNSLPVTEETEFIKHVTAPMDIEILVDGQTGHGIILKETRAKE